MRKVKTMAREIKKLSSSADNWAVIGTINDLIDEVMALDKVITRDIVRIATDEIIDELSEDTHRTVTLRIPNGMRIGEAISEAYPGGDSYLDSLSGWLIESSDTDLQKALDEVQPNE